MSRKRVKTAEHRKLCVGDTVTRRPKFTYDKDCKNVKTLRGTVVYVHPAGRFHTVDFGGVRESFAGVGVHMG